MFMVVVVVLRLGGLFHGLWFVDFTGVFCCHILCGLSRF